MLEQLQHDFEKLVKTPSGFAFGPLRQISEIAFLRRVSYDVTSESVVISYIKKYNDNPLVDLIFSLLGCVLT